MEYYSALYKNKITKFAGKWTELRGIILSEVTQVQKEKKKQHVLLHMESYYIVEWGRECINKYVHGYNMILRKREGSKFR